MRPTDKVWVQNLIKPRFWSFKLLSWNEVYFLIIRFIYSHIKANQDFRGIKVEHGLKRLGTTGIDSHIRVDVMSNWKVGRYRFNRTIWYLRLLNRAFKHASDPFASSCDPAGVKIGTLQPEILCPSRNANHGTLQVFGNTLQRVEDFKYLGGGIYRWLKMEQRDWYTDW